MPHAHGEMVAPTSDESWLLHPHDAAQGSKPRMYVAGDNDDTAFLGPQSRPWDSALSTPS